MLTNSISIVELKRSILDDLNKIFPGNEAYSVCKLILEHFGFSEISILKDPTFNVDNKIRSEIKKIVADLNKNKPIQYILGETIFFDLRFRVNENVLIPRPETEELLSKILLENTLPQPRILDIGTGSGCIAITLAHQIQGSSVSAIDVDQNVLDLASENAMLNGVQVEFIRHSVFDPKTFPDRSNYDLIVSNPPYVTEKDKLFMAQNVTKYEPSLALFVPDEDPLIFYRAIIQFAKDRMSQHASIWVEINENFGDELIGLFHQSGFSKARLMKDIHERNRFIKANK